MTESELQSWEQERAQGRDRFILRGLWRRSLRFAVVFSIVSFVLDLFTHRLLSVGLGVWNCLVTIATVTLAVGWCEGASIWYRREKEYSEARKT
jgi:hypothetical protein